jgi:hypothetical protein
MITANFCDALLQRCHRGGIFSSSEIDFISVSYRPATDFYLMVASGLGTGHSHEANADVIVGMPYGWRFGLCLKMFRGSAVNCCRYKQLSASALESLAAVGTAPRQHPNDGTSFSPVSLHPDRQ